ncbi:MAG: hypothetical protein JWM25_1747 [Thermoleophilia bacterium]|nr:hypothetical protein [Thermoleophilia bacterium]
MTMQCMNCATELLHPANFCPVCGARLAAPATDGSAATLPGGETPLVTSGPREVLEDNVVRLPFDAPATMAANPRANDYDGVIQHEQPPSAGPPTLQPQLPVPATDANNPFGDFFADGPSAWLEDDDDDEDHVKLDTPRLVGTFLAFGAILMLAAAWAVWILAMVRGAGGAEAGGFLLLAALLWIWYIALPRAKQHAAMLRWHTRIGHLVDRRVAPLRDRTEGSLTIRRERDRYRSMRDERTRRVNALGEGAYRAFRMGRLPVEMQGQAQRVMAMERQMLIQDHRIRGLVQPRNVGADTATDGPGDGQPPA